MAMLEFISINPFGDISNIKLDDSVYKYLFKMCNVECQPSFCNKK